MGHVRKIRSGHDSLPGKFSSVGQHLRGTVTPSQERTKRARLECVATTRTNRQEKKGAQLLTSKRAFQFRNSLPVRTFAERERDQKRISSREGQSLAPSPLGKVKDHDSSASSLLRPRSPLGFGYIWGPN